MGSDWRTSAQPEKRANTFKEADQADRGEHKKVGFLNPVIVDAADMVLAGHGRLEAARLEGLTHVPVVRFGHLTEAQKRAYVIADNKIAEQAGWDREILAIELGELIELLPAEGSMSL